MSKNITKERRKFKRAKRVLCVQHRLFKRGMEFSRGEWFYSNTQDMSLGGVFFISEIPYQVKDILQLRVIMSGLLEVFSGYGKVLRVKKKKTGHSFQTAVSFLSKASVDLSAVQTSPQKKTKKRNPGKQRKK